MIAQGLPKKRIAADLCISHETVNVHTKNVYRKTGSHCAADLTRYIIAHITQLDIDKALAAFARMCIISMFITLQGYIMSIPDEMDELRRPRPTRVRKVNRTKRQTYEID